mmetsp:Transcript_11430/g.34513  ORF Transcript_11430/g.34513 Transcript_11430/m.34513 type:complete len:206 (-) Transcript_11430:538-1155(-)
MRCKGYHMAGTGDGHPPDRSHLPGVTLDAVYSCPLQVPVSRLRAPRPGRPPVSPAGRGPFLCPAVQRGPGNSCCQCSGSALGAHSPGGRAEVVEADVSEDRALTANLHPHVLDGDFTHMKPAPRPWLAFPILDGLQDCLHVGPATGWKASLLQDHVDVLQAELPHAHFRAKGSNQSPEPKVRCDASHQEQVVAPVSLGVQHDAVP